MAYPGEAETGSRSQIRAVSSRTRTFNTVHRWTDRRSRERGRNTLAATLHPMRAIPRTTVARCAQPTDEANLVYDTAKGHGIYWTERGR